MLDIRFRSASPRVVAAVLILTSVASLQLGAALAATVFPIAGPVTLAALRMAGSAGALTVTGGSRAWRGSTREVLIVTVCLGVALAVMNTSVYLAIDRLPLGTAVTLEFLGPLGVALAGSRRRRDLVLALAAAAGVTLLAGGSLAGVDPVGVAMALLAAAAWAGYLLLGSWLGRIAPAGCGGLAVATVIAAVLTAPALLVRAPVLAAHPRVLLIGLAVGVLSSAVTNSLEQSALRRVEPALVALLMSLHPAAATAAGLVVLAQAPTAAQVTGTALVTVAGVAATARRGREPGP